MRPVSVLIFYNPFSSSTGGSIFIFFPFSTVHHMIETDSLFYLPNMVLARYYLYAHGVSPRLIAIEFFSTFLYVVFYFGTRILGSLYVLKQIVTRKITRFEATGSITIGIVTIASIMFIQKGDWFNPMQFAVCASFITNVFAALFMFELFKKNKIIVFFLGFVVFVLTFTPNLINLGYLNNPARYAIPKNEMNALNFLRQQPDGAVFIPIFEPDIAYVPAFTGKQTYVNFTNVLENTGIRFQKRLDQVKNPKTIQVDKLNIVYAYIPSAYKEHEILTEKFNESSEYKKIYANNETIIFRKISR